MADKLSLMTSETSFRVFVSAASGELASYREEVARVLRRRGIEVRDQEHFRQGGATLLDNLNGFRPKRSAADAIAQCFLSLSRKTSAQWILEGDIKACFDEIDHEWLKENICTDKHLLHQWLAAGYIEEGSFYDTESGSPQGGIWKAFHIEPYQHSFVMESDAVKVSSVGADCPIGFA